MAKKEKPLSVEETNALLAAAHSDPGSSAAMAARDRLVECNLGLCRSIAYSFVKQSAGFEVDDLIQEGALALLDAIRWFNPRKGIQFNTYAGRCVTSRIVKFLNSGKNKPLIQELDDPDENPVEQKLEPEETDNDRLRAAMDRLHPTDRLVVESRMGYEGPVVPWGDLASQLGISQPIVKRIYERAIVTLRRQVPEPSEN